MEETVDTKFIVVGIGASAGGMEAIHDLFDYMPSNTGLSFVVIQHLSPDYKSLMAELLSRHTNMKVYEAEDGMEIEPNSIYGIPSKKLMTIKAGKLELDEKLKNKLPNNAIDVFFESLAEDQDKDAVGIILSGTGTDGTRGIEAIKKRGGITIVQEPMSAAFDGMPNSAIGTDLVDLILPPEMIGEELLEYIREAPLLNSLSNGNGKDTSVLYSILDDVKQATSLDFTNYKRPTLFRRLVKRMTELSINSVSEYKDYLASNEDEMGILSKEFLINVTKFFRDTEAFDSLRRDAVPSIVANRKPEDPIKAWVVACSSGEEAYSIAILFLEHMESQNIPTTTLKIFATDIDSDALETASRGIYSENITRDVPPDLLQKYFIREGNKFRVTTELRRHVVFAKHDILKDPPFSHLSLVTCRNMFIYINSTLQQKALRKFQFALKIDAFLMLGPSENISVLKDSMEELNRKWKLYRCINKAGLVNQGTFNLPLDQGRIHSNFGKSTANTRNVTNHLADVFKETVLEGRKIAAIIIDKEFNVKQAIGTYKTFLKFPEERFNFNLLKLVSSDLAVTLGVLVRKALADDSKAVTNSVIIHDEPEVRKVKVIVKPYVRQQEYQQSFLCVILEEEDKIDQKSIRTDILNTTIESQERILELEAELTNTRENLQAVIEEIETSNEELQGTNEEMISTNEELQSTNEELQSLNEELHTVSAEHQLKIKELHEVNDDLNNYFNNSQIGQLLVDNDMIIRKFSPAVQPIVNLIEADIGRSIKDITTNLHGVDLIELIRSVIQTGRPVEKDLSLSDHRFYLLRITPYVRRDKSRAGTVVSFVDISEPTRLNSIIQSIFDSSFNGIAALKAIRNESNEIIDFEYIAANKASHLILQTGNTLLEGKSLVKIFREAREYIDLYIKVVATGQPSTYEFNNSKTGRWYNVSVAKMLDGVLTTHSDITEKRKAEDMIARNYEDLMSKTEQLKDSNTQLERSNFDLLQFASIASHDLKEPLRKIQAFGNILQGKIEGRLNTDEKSYFNKIISSSQRMQILIEDVLSLSKLSNSTLSKDEVDLSKMMYSIIDDLEISINEKNAVIRVGNLPVVRAVAGQMRQLFQNLISNALKFRDPKKERPEIIVEKKKLSPQQALAININADKFACVSVRDNGIGFEDEYKDKIFGIFQRLHGRTYEGTGIGLAIARKIVENHAGYIIASGGLGRGAEFFIVLPLE